MQQDKPIKKFGEVAYPSGATVPTSGMWRTGHKECFNAPDLWLRRQATFPPCPGCGLDAGFHLLEKIVHISEDPDFQEPA
ncbi:MAG: hypothetical protein LAO78_04175 [Acidobacteriia bacterium]|nr:hypothetical protein [Terriglobia bacterium]